MKKLLMIFALIIGLVSCGSGENTANAKSPEKDRVEVIYFHGKQRCATCMAIEKNTREVINNLFANELKNGTVVFKILDNSTHRKRLEIDRGKYKEYQQVSGLGVFSDLSCFLIIFVISTLLVHLSC